MKTNLIKKQEEIAHLDAATQAIIQRLNKNDRRLQFWAFLSLSLLLVVGLFGIFKQNQIANANKGHIDCIVKLLATPLPEGAKGRVLSNPSTTCNIRFTP